MTLENVGPWVLSFVGIVGFVLTGRLVWWGWWVNVGCQALWFAFAFYTGLWGFFIGAFFYTIVFLDNAIGWTKRHRERERAKNAWLDTTISHGEIFAKTLRAETLDVNSLSADKIIPGSIAADKIRTNTLYSSTFPKKSWWKIWVK